MHIDGLGAFVASAMLKQNLIVTDTIHALTGHGVEVLEWCGHTPISHTASDGPGVMYGHTINPLTSISHCSGFKVKLTFHGTQVFWL